jgi:hypothetical protein
MRMENDKMANGKMLYEDKNHIYNANIHKKFSGKI